MACRPPSMTAVACTLSRCSAKEMTRLPASMSQTSTLALTPITEHRPSGVSAKALRVPGLVKVCNNAALGGTSDAVRGSRRTPGSPTRAPASSRAMAGHCPLTSSNRPRSWPSS